MIGKKISSTYQRLIKVEFIKNTVIISGGSFLATVFNVVAYPLITHIYTPEAYGYFSIVQSIFLIISQVATLKFEVAINVAKNEEESQALFKLSSHSVWGFSILNFLVFVALNQVFVSFFPKFQAISTLFYFVPLLIFFRGSAYTYMGIFNRNKLFKEIAWIEVIRSFFSNTAFLIFPFLWGPTPTVLLLGFSLGIFMSWSYTCIIFQRKQNILWRPIQKKLNLWKYFKLYYKFPLFLSMSTFVVTLSLNIPILLLGVFYNQKEVGFFSLAQKLLLIPVTILSESVRKVSLQKMSEKFNSGENILKDFKSDHRHLLWIAVIPFALMAFGALLFAGVIVGKEWSQTGLYIALLSPYFFSFLITTPASAVQIIHDKQQVKLLFELISLILSSLSIYLCHLLRQPTILAIISYVIIGMTINFFFISYGFHVAGQKNFIRFFIRNKRDR